MKSARGTRNVRKSAPAPLSAAIRVGEETFGHLHLTCTDASLERAGRRFLNTAAEAFTKVAALEDRHTRLTKLATTDQLTYPLSRGPVSMCEDALIEFA